MDLQNIEKKTGMMRCEQKIYIKTSSCAYILPHFFANFWLLDAGKRQSLSYLHTDQLWTASKYFMTFAQIIAKNYYFAFTRGIQFQSCDHTAH